MNGIKCATGGKRHTESELQSLVVAVEDEVLDAEAEAIRLHTMIEAAYFEGYSDRNDCPLEQLVSDCWGLSKTKAGLDLTDSNIEGSGMVGSG